MEPITALISRTSHDKFPSRSADTTAAIGFRESVRRVLPAGIEDNELRMVTDTLVAANVTTADALTQLMRTADRRDAARSIAAGTLGFSGFAAGQIAGTLLALRLAEKTSSLSAPVAGSLIFCILNTANADTIAAARLGARYNATPPIGPLGETADQRNAQSVCADMPFHALGLALTASSAVGDGLKLSAVPALALNMTTGLGGAGVTGYFARTAARSVQLANASRIEQWLTPGTTHTIEDVAKNIQDLQQSSARAVLGYMGDVTKAFVRYSAHNIATALTSPRLFSLLIAAAPFTGLGIAERAGTLRRFAGSAGKFSTLAYTELRWVAISFGWAYRREIEHIISIGSFTHTGAQRRLASILQACYTRLQCARVIDARPCIRSGDDTPV